MEDKVLNELRKEIEDIDGKLIKFLNERAKLSIKIGARKKTLDLPIVDTERESFLYNRLLKLNLGPLHDDHLLAIYREIISSSRALQKDIRVSYLGPEGTFTHMAAMKQFGSSSQYFAMTSIKDVFREVEAKNSDYGVVPVENSVEGVVTYTLDTFFNSNLRVVGEVYLKVSHVIASNRNGFSKVYGHPQAIAQCREWLSKNLPDVSIIGVGSSAEAAIKAASDTDAACITTRLAAQKYGLNIVKEHIEDYPSNTTRFWILGRKLPGPTGEDKTSILFSVKNVPGALCRVLEVFAVNNINLTKLESRPMKSVQWEYLFFADLTGHYTDERVKKSLTELNDKVNYFKLLGSYPKGI